MQDVVEFFIIGPGKGIVFGLGKDSAGGEFKSEVIADGVPVEDYFDVATFPGRADGGVQMSGVGQGTVLGIEEFVEDIFGRVFRGGDFSGGRIHLMAERGDGDGKNRSMLPAHIMNAFCTYDWPGNVRELQNELQRYLSNQPLEFVGDVQAESETQDDLFRPGGDLANLALPEALEAFEKRAITTTLAQHQGNTNKAAEVLGISLRTLQRKIKKYRIEHDKDFV